MNSVQIKEKLLSQCRDYVSLRQKRLTDQISDLQKALESETKSSAGDKHETGRAMLHLDREKLGIQLAEVQKLNVIVSKIAFTPSQFVKLGCLVYTTGGIFFISISIGTLDAAGISCFVIAANSPIGKLLLGKKINDTVQFNGNPIVIEKII